MAQHVRPDAAELGLLAGEAKEPYAWTGMDAFLAVVCFNKPEGEKRKAAAPVSWTDLTKPEYKDQVVMPHPASSGTGYLTVAAWILCDPCMLRTSSLAASTPMPSLVTKSGLLLLPRMI
jgi:ABC-type Fe3+ transport system substrate-binding protein